MDTDHATSLEFQSAGFDPGEDPQIGSTRSGRKECPGAGRTPSRPRGELEAADAFLSFRRSSFDPAPLPRAFGEAVSMRW